MKRTPSEIGTVESTRRHLLNPARPRRFIDKRQEEQRDSCLETSELPTVPVPAPAIWITQRKDEAGDSVSPQRIPRNDEGHSLRSGLSIARGARGEI